MPNMIEVIPFGMIDPDRFELSKKYNLVEKIANIWRLTQKCKNNYTVLSYIYYLKGELEKPEKLNEQNVQETTIINKEKETIPQKQMIINDLLQL